MGILTKSAVALVRRRRRLFGICLAATAGLAALAAPSAAQEPTLASALRDNRHALRLTDKGLRGPGAELLLRAVDSARLIGIGEDHATVEIPRLVEALCKRTASSLSALVLEAGPQALGAIGPILAAPDREKRMKDFTARYPSGIAFLDIAADNAMAANCLAAAPQAKAIGIDQEFLGSAGLLLDRILAERLSPAARNAVRRAREEDARRSTIASASGNPGDAFLLGADDKDLAPVTSALAAGGTPRARAIWASLLESRDIYRTKDNSSNVKRAALLKRNLAKQLPASGKVMVRMGDWHIYRGYNPLHNRDLGNWLAEQADQEGQPSLHILVLGSKGVHALYGGYDRPFRREPFTMSDDRDYRWIKLASDASSGLAPSEWALFDLRPISHASLGEIDVQWRRVLDGYDLLILVPELTPSQALMSQ